MRKLGILFAGQGSQSVGMGSDFYEASAEFKSVFSLLSEEERKIAFHGPEEKLKQTLYTQPILLAFGLGVYRMLSKHGIRPSCAAGLSLGEYTALAAAGVWDPEEALDIIRFRAEAMTKSSAGISTVMSAVLGCDRHKLLRILEEINRMDGEHRVEVANFNCPDQIVISGDEKGVRLAEERLLSSGAKRCIPLPVSGPFHTSYMKEAGKALAEHFQDVSFGMMNFPIYFNAIGRRKTEAESIPDLLARQVSCSVYMEDIIRAMAKDGVNTILEIGPGKALSGFVKKTDKSIEVFSISTMEEAELIIRRLGNDA